MSTIKSSSEHLVLNADGANKSVKFQSDGVEKASINSAGLFTSTTIDATKLTGALPTLDGSNLTGIDLASLTDATVSASDPTISTNPSAVGHLWVNSTSGEQYVCTDATAGSNVWTNTGEGTGSVVPGTYIAATGPDSTAGTIDGDYKYHVFNATKTGSNGFVVSNVGNAYGSNTVEYLVVAGGGGGGLAYGGGGGAGGYRTSTGFSAAVTSYNITVGGGGSFGYTYNDSTNGNDSVFSSITSTGGGRGGDNGTVLTGGSGGSGGGSKSGAAGSGISGQGHDGSEGTSDNLWTGAGGGAGAAGGAPVQGTRGGHGGDGLSSSITGSAVTRAGGGGGGGTNTQRGNGGAGGGGGANQYNPTVNYGGGGAGGGHNTDYYPSSGASGVVIIRYKFQN